MIGIVVTGHGNFPAGILAAARLIAGDLVEKTVGVDFDPSQNIDQLQIRLSGALAELGCDEVLVLADLLGGTPFNAASLLRAQRPDLKMAVVGGANLAMLLEATFMRSDSVLVGLVTAVKQAGINGIAELADDAEVEPDDAEEGL